MQQKIESVEISGISEYKDINRRKFPKEIEKEIDSNATEGWFVHHTFWVGDVLLIIYRKSSN